MRDEEVEIEGFPEEDEYAYLEDASDIPPEEFDLELKPPGERPEKRIRFLEQELEFYKSRLALFVDEGNHERKAYNVLLNIFNQQIKLLSSFKLKDRIGDSSRDDKEYERTKAIWEKLTEIVTNLNDLKSKMDSNKAESSKVEESIQTAPLVAITSPERIANALGNTAGQQR